MNRKILPYVNYLLDNEPSPFCDYIICKELLEPDEKAIQESYDWAVRFKLYAELHDEQMPDGSWSGFEDMIAEQAKGKHFKSTTRAMSRMLDLALDISDPMVLATVELCRQYVSGEKDFPNVWGKNNWGKRIGTRHSAARWLTYFEPDNIHVAKLRGQYAERLNAVCKSGCFSENLWEQTDYHQHGVFGGCFAYDKLYMLFHGNCISEEIERIWLKHEWYENRLWYNGNLPSEIKTPNEKSFIFWLTRLEYLQRFSLFGEFMEAEVAPNLYSLCERLCNPAADMDIKTNNYFYHQGQYSEAPRNRQHKKSDLLLRIIRLLNKCD